MKREIGCCTWTFGDASLEEVAKHVRGAGLDGVELLGDVENVDPVIARHTLENEGLKVFSITPADADISHPDESVRKVALEYYEQLMDFAVVLGNPLISCHGQVTRIKPITSQSEEDKLLMDSTQHICDFAAAKGLNVVFEILNRYETHQIRTVDEGLSLLTKVGAGNLKLLPDAYHMNIEEADPAVALMRGGSNIGLYHAADSNRCGIGEGNTDFTSQIKALDSIGYAGPIILETNAPGPNPFTPDKGDGFRKIVEHQLKNSVVELRKFGT